MNSTSTEDSSFTRCLDNKEILESQEKENCEDEEGLKISKDKQRTISKPTYFRKSSDQCFVRNIFEKHGGLYIFDKNNLKLFISRIKIVNFPMNRDIFDKGRHDHTKYFDLDTSTIPEIKFWYQRYYYYSKFDKGIKMDYESMMF
jgi:hypothetical protein